MATQTRDAVTIGRTLPGKFVWFEHVSPDARSAEAFYREVLGWKVQPWGDTGYDMILAGDTLDTMIGGYTKPGTHDRRAHWLSYVSVEDVDAAARAVSANGGTVVEAPHDVPEAGHVARISDPQGAELCLFKKQGGDGPDSPATEPPPSRRFFWCELHTRDPLAALSFYEKVVGFSPKAMDTGPAGVYYILSRDGVGRGGVTGHLAPDVPPHWLPYVAVEDPDATVARARNLGGTIHVQPADIPHVGRFAVLEDPTGAFLAVMKAIPPR